ncbi:enterotoxin A family protein [Candidatus Enterovibrio escicola]|uniref:enterotoxin A family protein n=1 Tax=Candidatus Enterovibrio escicola TaxID=1927127 RepID=UPI001237F565|nr:enterotoxin A family protein [Candidatus Enterovibrio escacola]
MHINNLSYIRFLLILIILLFSFNNSLASDYFRDDSRTPNEVIRSNGLLSRGHDNVYEYGTPQNISLYNHALGNVLTGNTRFNDGYISTTNSLTLAHNFGQNLLGGQSVYYIYVIASAPNIFDLNGVLGRYSPHPSEYEFSALGGVPLSQIIGWYRVSFGVVDVSMSRNPAYYRTLFRALGIAPTEDGYRLAGFPDGHRAWRE